MQPKPNVVFCPACRSPRRPNEVSCSQCGTRSCPNGHPISSKICSLCGWEDRTWKARSYSQAAPIQKAEEVPDAREGICPHCKTRTVFTTNSCPNCGYILGTAQPRGMQQEAMSSAPTGGSAFKSEKQHYVVPQQYPGVHGYMCPRCGAKADPMAGNCPACGYIGSMEHRIPQQQSSGGAPPAQAAKQQGLAGQQVVQARDTSPGRACPSCGAKIPSDSKFCQRCGKASGTGRAHEKFIPVTDRIMSGAPMPMSQMVPSMDTGYATELVQDLMGPSLPGVDDVSIALPKEKKRGKEKDKAYQIERKGFPTGLLAAVFVVAAALVAMVMFIVSQIIAPATPPPTITEDKTPPVISGVTVSSVTGSSVIMEWTTDEKATSQIMLCDTGGVCTWTDPDATLVKYHSVQVNDLKLNVPYHITVKSIDASGNEGSSEMEQTFTKEPQPDTTAVGPEKGKRAPDFTLKDLNGNNVKLSSFRGKNIVMVNFWATTCIPCKNELPDIEAVYKGRSGAVVVLAVNAGESKADAKSFIDSTNYTFPVLLDPNKEARTPYNITDWPWTFFIDKSGIIKEVKHGAFASKAEIENILNTMQ